MQRGDSSHPPRASVCQSCNGLDCFGNDTIASAGEDGRVFVLRPGQQGAVRTFEKADSCSLTALIFVKQNEARELRLKYLHT